jgi:hypothetical protein
MGWDRRTLIDQETQSSDAATRRIALPRGGVLSALAIQFRCQNGATAGEEALVDAIDRVEVVADGSNVLFSLEGSELHRWNWFWLKDIPPGIRDERASTQTQTMTLCVLFGRFIGDPRYSLNLANYRDVELRVQYSPTIAATSFTTGTFRIHVDMYIADRGAMPGPREGFLRTTQIFAFTSAASGEQRIELARLYPHWDMMVYAREAGIDDGVDITQVELQLNNKAIIPFTARWDMLQAENEKYFDIEPSSYLRALRADNAAITMYTGRILDAQVKIIQDVAAAADFDIADIASIAGDQITLHMALIEGSATYAATILETTRRGLLVDARGLGVGNAIVLPFAGYFGEEAALNAPEYDRAELVLTNGGAGADVRVSTRELVRV